MVQLFIKNSFLKIPFCIHVSANDTIQAIRERYNISNSLKLYHRSVLEEHHTIEHYKLMDNDTIHLSVGLSGGIPIVDAGCLAIVPVLTAIGVKMGVSDALKVVNDKVEFQSETMMKIREMMNTAIQHAQNIMQMAKFLPIITLVGIVLGFLAAPMEFMLLIFGLVVVTLLYVIYAVLNLPPFIFVVAAIWFLIMDIIPLILYCVIYAAILILIFVGCLIMAGINGISGGSLKDIVLCDNSPGSWYKTPNYHLGNRWERGIFCTRPCFSRYAPDSTGTGCVTLPKGYPPYCPQAEIMRIYSSKQTDSKYKYDNYFDTGNISYMAKKPLQREFMLKDYYLRKRNFMNICNKELSGYNDIALNICTSVDAIDDLPQKEKDRLKQVCQQAFCSTDKNYPFCSKMSEVKDDDRNAIIKKVIKILVIIIVFSIIILYTFKRIYKL